MHYFLFMGIIESIGEGYHNVNNIDRYLARKLIEKAPGEKDLPEDRTEFIASAAKRSFLEYYKNNCISYFIPAAFTALAVLKKDAFQFISTNLHTEYQWCQDFFKYEFAFDLERPPAQCVRKVIKAFIDDAMLMPHPTLPECYQVTATGYRKLRSFAAFLKPYFESYRVALRFIEKNRKEDLDVRDKLKKIQSLGHQMVKTGEIDLVESVSKINYANGLNYFVSKGVKSHADSELIAYYDACIQTNLNAIKP